MKSKPKKTVKTKKEKPSDEIYKIYVRIYEEHKCSPGSGMAADYEYYPAAIVEWLDTNTTV